MAKHHAFLGEGKFRIAKGRTLHFAPKGRVEEHKHETVEDVETEHDEARKVGAFELDGRDVTYFLPTPRQWQNRLWHRKPIGERKEA